MGQDIVLTNGAILVDISLAKPKIALGQSQRTHHKLHLGQDIVLTNGAILDSRTRCSVDRVGSPLSSPFPKYN
jgi:hypothetical protein